MKEADIYGSNVVLARIFAKEDITIEHDEKAKTASCNLKDRHITLPIFSIPLKPETYTMFAAHEASHIIHTPLKGWEELKKKFKDDMQKTMMFYSLVNIIEDPRIDKLQLIRYPGLERDYMIGNADLLAQDFYGINKAKVTVDSHNIVDRLNLHFKLGRIGIDIPFAPEEKKWVDRVDTTKSFKDVVKIAEDLWKEKSDELMKNAGKGSSSGDIYIDASKMTSKEFSEMMSKLLGKVDKALKESMEKAVKTSNGRWGGYSHYGKKIITKKFTFGDIQRYITDINQKRSSGPATEASNESGRTIIDLYTEFQRRKSASTYLKTKTYKTGEIDPLRLHTASFNEDIFKTNRIVPKGKNHGFFFVLDWSGSMSGPSIDAALKQAYILAEFCRRANVPFEILALSSGYGNSLFPLEIIVDNLAVLRVSNKEIKNRQLLIEKINGMTSHYGNMGGTPLNAMIEFLIHYVPLWQLAKKVEVMNVILLTDGGSNGFMMSDHDTSLSINGTHNGRSVFVPTMKSRHHSNTEVLIDYLRKSSGCNVMNYFLTHNPGNKGNTVYNNLPDSRFVKHSKNLVEVKGLCSNSTMIISPDVFKTPGKDSRLFVNKAIEIMA